MNSICALFTKCLLPLVIIRKRYEVKRPPNEQSMDPILIPIHVQPSRGLAQNYIVSSVAWSLAASCLVNQVSNEFLDLRQVIRKSAHHRNLCGVDPFVLEGVQVV